MRLKKWAHEREDFFALKTARDIANFFGIDYSRLVYRLYRTPGNKKYISFYLPKKNGSAREICAPISPIKNTQKKLNIVLQNIYQPKTSVYGFCKKKLGQQRNIVTNAKNHVRKRYVFNIDLKNFFPTINYGRVRGMFMKYPFYFNPSVATVLAQICCFNNYLPQGAPSSPIVSNFICAKMDSEIMRLAKANRCSYTRYADDLTFSTSIARFPVSLAFQAPDGQIKIGNELRNIIEKNGFEVNFDKLRLARRYQRQVVTGLTVNKFPNVNRKFLRQLRAMIYAWGKFGLIDAEREYFSKYNKTHRNPENKKPSFEDIVNGKVNFVKMVRGKNDKIYKSLSKKLAKCKENFVIPFKYDKGSQVPLIITEGKTDWKHLKTALAFFGSRGVSYNIEFQEYGDEVSMGDINLLKLCNKLSKTNSKRIIICIFDRDNKNIINKVISKNKKYKSWGRNVYSLAIPKPSHRSSSLGISIELYYKDDEIKRKDSGGRRLFLSNEFCKPSGRYKENDEIICQDKRFSKPTLSVIDDKVYTRKEKISMKKNDFAENVFRRKSNFNNFDYSEFTRIFDLINKIVQEQ